MTALFFKITSFTLVLDVFQRSHMSFWGRSGTLEQEKYVFSVTFGFCADCLLALQKYFLGY